MYENEHRQIRISLSALLLKRKMWKMIGGTEIENATEEKNSTTDGQKIRPDSCVFVYGTGMKNVQDESEN